MKFSLYAGFLFAGTSLATTTCKPLSASCVAVTALPASQASCSSLFSTSKIKSSTCTSFVSASQSTATKFVTKTVTLSVTDVAASTRTILRTNQRSTATVTTTVVGTTTSTSTVPTTLLPITTITSTEVDVVTSTTVTTDIITFTLIPPLARLLRRAVPSDCSCFLTSTKVTTTTPKPTTTTSTVFVTTYKTTTSKDVSTITLSFAGTTFTSSVPSTTTIFTTVTDTTSLPPPLTTFETTTTTFKTITTTSETIVPYVPPQPPAFPDISCGNAGLQVAIFDNPLVASGDGVGYPSYHPEDTKTDSSGLQGSTVVDYLGLQPIDAVYPFGFQPSVANQYSAVYRGYFYAPVSGTYEITLDYADDIAFFWRGFFSYTFWARGNENLIQYFDDVDLTTENYVYLNAGQYLPIRIVYANGGGGAGFQFNILGPDSATYYVQSYEPSPYLVQYGCGASAAILAPPFTLPFGAEV